MENITSKVSIPVIKIAFLDVGQADTIVVSSPSTHEAIVIDCVNANAVFEYLEQEQITFLRGVIITHLHADHYRAVPSLLKNYTQVPGLQECEWLAFNRYETTSIAKQKYNQESVYHGLVNWSRQHKGKQTSLTAERQLPFDGELAKAFTLIHPYEDDLLLSGNPNDTSIIMRVNGSKTSALLTGDIETSGWNLAQSQSKAAYALQGDILKFPHHGSWKDEDVESLLDTVKPSVVVISVGSNNFYQHPNLHVFSAIANHPKIRLLCTQATDQCSVGKVEAKRASVVTQFKAAIGNNQKLRINKSGCPCAGTIIVELSDHVSVVQPTLRFHQEKVIEPHFQRHQCSF